MRWLALAIIPTIVGRWGQERPERVESDKPEFEG